MPGIKIKDNESLDNALARFKKQCAKYGVLAFLLKFVKENITKNLA